MPRPRLIPVFESVQELRRIERSLKKNEACRRITMLRLLKKDPTLTLKDVADQLGVTHHATKRWWHWYMHGGIARLQQGTGTTVSTGKDRTLHALRDNIASGTFRTVGQVMQWLGADRPRTKGQVENSAPTTHPFTAKIIDFLNTIPSTGDPQIWVDLFRAALAQTFWDIDRVSATVNLNCDLASPESYHPQVGTIQHIDDVKIPIAIDIVEEEHDKRLLKNFRRQGFPFKKYHPPVCLTYYYRDSAYLGIIVLWRDRSQRPISRETLDVVERLRPFFIYLFSDAIVRFHYMKPVTSASIQTLDRIATDYELSTQQRRVLALHMTGATPEAIADSMNISAHTVRSHIKLIYRKTNVHSVNELFAQYFVSPLRRRGSE